MSTFLEIAQAQIIQNIAQKKRTEWRGCIFGRLVPDAVVCVFWLVKAFDQIKKIEMHASLQTASFQAVQTKKKQFLHLPKNSSTLLGALRSHFR